MKQLKPFIINNQPTQVVCDQKHAGPYTFPHAIFLETPVILYPPPASHLPFTILSLVEPTPTSIVASPSPVHSP